MDKGTNRESIQWRWGGTAALAMALLALYPQIQFWIIRGANWNGSYAVIEGVGDEIAYSSYVNALIEGRPRRNDPYTGRDADHNTPQSDSLFSIQFVPAYLIALPARFLGLSAATAFILLSPLAAAASALALFWLLSIVTGLDRLSAAGVVIVLCLGTLVGGHGQVISFFGQQPLYNYLMFLRRYQPAASFPLFLIFCAAVWLGLTVKSKKSARLSAMMAALVFTLLVFSYVYLWTAALAWVGCIILLWLLGRPGEWRLIFKTAAVVIAAAAGALLSFALCYSNRGATLESVQALEFSHTPDFFRVPELIGIAVLLGLAYLVKRSVLSFRSPEVLLTVSFACLPLMVFNQQIVTGLSLQPLHYEMFVANYSVLIALVLTAAQVKKSCGNFQLRLPRKTLLWIAVAAFEWGSFETLLATRGSLSMEHQVDDARAVAVRLAQIAETDEQKNARATLLSTDLIVADSLPTTAPQPVLWAPHMLVFSGATANENRERFFQYLYYTGITPDQLRTILTTDLKYGFAVGLFGFERSIRGLSQDHKPITRQELEEELKNYAAYCASFTYAHASQFVLSFVVVGPDKADLSNFDRWYERDAGEPIGKFMLYRTRLRDDPRANEATTTKNSSGHPQS